MDQNHSDLAGTVDPEVGRMHLPDLLHEHQVPPGSRRGPRRIGRRVTWACLVDGAIGSIPQIGSTPQTPR